MSKKKSKSVADSYAIRFNKELNQYHYCPVTEVNEKANGWVTVAEVESEAEALKIIKEKKGE